MNEEWRDAMLAATKLKTWCVMISECYNHFYNCLLQKNWMRHEKIGCVWSFLWICGLKGKISVVERTISAMSVDRGKMKVCKYNTKTSGKEHILNCVWWRMFRLLIRIKKLQGMMSIKGSKSKRLKLWNIDRRRLKQRISDQKLLGGEIVEHYRSHRKQIQERKQ